MRREAAVWAPAAARPSSIEGEVWVPVLQSAFVAAAWALATTLALAALVIVCWWPTWIPFAGAGAMWAGDIEPPAQEEPKPE